jgi:hypothetical protein
MTARPTTPALSRLLELLELEQPRVVTRRDIERYADQAGVEWPSKLLLQRLRERGWLLDLKTRGVWEFAPAARAGAYSSGDPLIELRATLARNPDAPFAVAAESAAYLLGYASRRPDPDVVSVSADVTVPPALREYRVVHWQPREPLEHRDQLPVWAPTTLLAFMATKPALYRDWPNAGEWLPRAAAAASADRLCRELNGRPRSSWARAGYLLSVGGKSDSALQILAHAPEGAGPYYLGSRSRPGRHSKTFDVIDSSGLEVTST